MRHSDQQTDFPTGAKRDDSEGKGSPSLISPVLLHRTGEHLRKGEEHYPRGDDNVSNWSKGMPFRRTADSLIRHIYQWLAGDDEEDHLAAIVCNAMFLMHFEEAIASGGLPETLDDRDPGLKKILASILTSAPTNAKMKADAKPEVEEFDPRMGVVKCVTCKEGMSNTGLAHCPTCMKDIGEQRNEPG